MRRRRFVLGAAAAAVLLGAAVRGHAAAPAGTRARRVPVVARKFAFSVTTIAARAGEDLVLVLTATDFVHGFALPELSARADVPPGKEVELVLKSLKPGRYTFLCDNFCGEEHDRMMGTLEVSAT